MEYIIFLIIAVLIVVPAYIIYFVYNLKKEQRRLEWLSSMRFTTLRIDVPKNNDKMPLASEQMFASIHGIFSHSAFHQYHLSFEVVAKDKFIQFYVTVPTHLKDFIEGQIYAQYPTVEINEVDDFAEGLRAREVNFAVTELEMTKPDVYPIRFFDSFEVDPLAGITSVMSKLGSNERVWIQLLIRPVGDNWQERGNNIVSAVRAGKKPGGQAIFDSIISGAKNSLKAILVQAVNPGVETAPSDKNDVKLPSTVEDALKGIEQKITKLGFETKIRILSIANDPVTAEVKCQSVAAAFKQFNTTNLNGFKVGTILKNNFDAWQAFVGREFVDKGNILNITELASIYHLPNQTVETPSIVWSGSKKGEPPANLPLEENTPPEDLTVIGMTNFRNDYRKFGIKLDDRKRHVYMIGKSGTGKSTLIENMAIDDVYEGRGVIVVDPHGELADKVLSCIPDERVADVIVFDPADRAYPIAFNLLEAVEDDFKGMVASGFVGIFKKIFGDSWGPRLEHILRNTVLALLDYPNSTMLDIPRMLTDIHFRNKVVLKVKDPVIREFWVNEFAQYDSKFRTEAVSPILNKVGQFLATATIRNIVGQYHSRINIRDIMDQKKILVINLSRGKIGEDNSALLGAMVITKIQLAAMSRADVTLEKRSDSFLYVDEFQNFATDSFGVILSEARKYNLCLTMANQYIEQMPETVRSAVFGNAGTIVTFRVGGTDASFLVKEFEPVFEVNDLVNLDKYNIYIKLLVEGISSPAFSAKTLPPVDRITGNIETIINQTHTQYATSRSVVEAEIERRSKEDEEEMKAEAEAFRQGGLEALLVKKSRSADTTRPESRSSGAAATEEEIPTPEVEAEETKKEDAASDEVEAGVPASAESGMREKKEEVSTEKKNFDMAGESGQETEKDRKPRILRYQNIIGDKIYKEQTARGGVKWYVGEEIDREKLDELGVGVTPEAEKMINLAKKVGTNPALTKAFKGDSGSKEVQEEVKKTDTDDTEVTEKILKPEAPAREDVQEKEAQDDDAADNSSGPNLATPKIHSDNKSGDLEEGEEIQL